jgi:hypothetical protein
LLLVLLVAGLLLALVWSLRRADAGGAVSWRPPRVSFGRDAARAAEPSSEGDAREWATVSCVVDEALGEDPGRLVATSSEGAAAVVSTASGRELSLVLVPGDWRVTWHGAAEGQRSQTRRIGTVEVEAGSVDRCRIEGAGWTLSGRVSDLDGRATPGALVEGCGADTTTDDQGRYTLVARRGDCLLRAWSRDGQLRRPGEAEYFDAFAPPASLDLEVDVDPIGGVGLGLSSGSEGLSVAFVAGGSPASAAGIVAGDLVVAVDGAVTAGWSVLRGVQTITGEPGSAVELRVRDAAGTERVITVERARIEEEEANPVDTGASVAP